MPTIEIVSIGCPQIPDLPRYPSLAYIAETTLQSHRELFQSVFDSLSGVIVHLANKELEGEEDRIWFAGRLMNWEDDEALVFLPDAHSDVTDLMQHLIAASPHHRIIFSTDYQFGGERQECGETTLTDFFDLHDRQALRYNTLYFVKPDT